MPCGTVWSSMTADDKRVFFESQSTDAEYRASCLRDADHHARVRQELELVGWRLWEPLPALPIRPA